MFLSVDVEPDENVDVGRSGPASWTGCGALAQHLDELRTAFTAESGLPVAVGWYLRMDPQIEALCGDIDRAADRFAESIEPRDHDYQGLHVHRTRWDSATSQWVIDDDERLWLEHLRRGLEAYTRRMGSAPLRHRFTTIRVLTPEMLTTLASAGVVADLTEEPMPGAGVLSRPPQGASFPTSACPVTMIRGSSVPYPPYRASALRRAARRARRPFARWYLSPYRNGLAPMHYWDEVSRSLDFMRSDSRYVSIAFRTEPRGGPADERHGELFRSFLQHPIRHRVRFADPADFAQQSIADHARAEST